MSKPEGIEKLISLAAGFYAAGGSVIGVRDADIDKYGMLAAARAPRGTISPVSNFGRISSALMRTDNPSTRRFVALDGDRRVIGATSYYPWEGGIYMPYLGTTGEVKGTGAALIAATARTPNRSFLKVTALGGKAPAYYSGIGFVTINDLGDMRLSSAHLAHLQRATARVVSL